ncbi:5-carboxymethyl-2-hydroxymuconate Delta-isomerase [Alteribacter aurantiacus]|uniref:5-carboxymethyl-2-hydroxymuconate Delta-isomerase n=1 Tax=Alteribacter aurantiacus TaxID=254410 RepID=UPI00041FE49E|nr:5-carboxymethyl-2-hydroxymuconate Delta-isomerase [Alteribacter aurantiacus]
MPHIIVEYSDNINETNLKTLLHNINRVFADRPDTYPIGGIRSRAMPLTDYVVADGSNPDDAFVHTTIKIGAGRSEKVKKATCDEVFQVITDHFADIYEKRYLALSLELIEFSETGTLKKNNIHQRYKK